METLIQETKKQPLTVLEEHMLELQREIDVLALQLSLGKASAREKFAEAKREFQTKLTGLKQLFNHVTIGKFVPVRLEWKLQDLELQLQSNDVGSPESFEAQRSALVAATTELAKEVAGVFHKAKQSNHFRHEVEKFLLKLEIIRLKFGIKRFEIKDSFRSNMRGAERVIRQISGTVQGSQTKVKTRKREAKREIAAVYKHLRTAVRNL